MKKKNENTISLQLIRVVTNLFRNVRLTCIRKLFSRFVSIYKRQYNWCKKKTDNRPDGCAPINNEQGPIKNRFAIHRLLRKQLRLLNL